MIKFIRKEISKEDVFVIEASCGVACGEVIPDLYIQKSQDSYTPFRKKLDRIEDSVIRLLKTGRPVADIASELGVTPPTVYAFIRQHKVER